MKCLLVKQITKMPGQNQPELFGDGAPERHFVTSTPKHQQIISAITVSRVRARGLIVRVRWFFIARQLAYNNLAKATV